MSTNHDKFKEILAKKLGLSEPYTGHSLQDYLDAVTAFQESIDHLQLVIMELEETPTSFKSEIAQHLGISARCGLAHFINAINKLKSTKTK